MGIMERNIASVDREEEYNPFLSPGVMSDVSAEEDQESDRIAQRDELDDDGSKSAKGGHRSAGESESHTDQVNVLRAKLETVLQEKTDISRQLASFVQGEIQSILSSINPYEHSNDETPNATMKQLDEALSRAKVLFEENASLRRQLAVAENQLVEKKRVEADLTRVKEYWKILSKVIPVYFTSAGNRGKEKEGKATTDELLLEDGPIANRLLREKEALAEENAKLKNKNVVLLQKMESSGERNSIDATVAQLRGEIDFLKVENEKLRNVNSTNAQLGNDVVRLSRDLNLVTQRASHETMQLQAENRRLSELAARGAEIGQMLETAREASRVQMEEKERMKVQLSRMNNELVLNMKKMESLTKECGHHQHNSSLLQQENAHLKKEIESARNKNTSSTDENRLLEGENYMLKEECEQWTKKVYAYKKAAGEANDKLKMMAGDCGLLKGVLGDMKQEWQRARDSIISDLSKASRMAGLEKVKENQRSLASVQSDHNQKIAVLIKEKDTWKEKYQSICQKVLAAKRRSVEQSCENKNEAGGVVSNDEKKKEDAPGASTHRPRAEGPTKKNQSGAKRAAPVSVEMSRLKGVLYDRFLRGSSPNAVYTAAESVWDTINNTVGSVLEENQQLRSELRFMNRCIVASKRRESVEKVKRKLAPAEVTKPSSKK